MQTLDVISINIWQMLVALVNLLIIFLIAKKFLYMPVKKMLDARQKSIDDRYAEADEAKRAANADKVAYAEKLAGAKAEANTIIEDAVSIAKAREKEILADARSEAEGIISKAEMNAELELKRAEDVIKSEIVDVSTRLSEKLLGREIKAEDHTDLIDSFINEIGEAND